MNARAEALRSEVLALPEADRAELIDSSGAWMTARSRKTRRTSTVSGLGRLLAEPLRSILARSRRAPGTT
jgi:hypothetical protein